MAGKGERPMRRAAVISILGLGLASAGAEAAPTTDTRRQGALEGPTWRLVALGQKSESALGPDAA